MKWRLIMSSRPVTSELFFVSWNTTMKFLSLCFISVFLLQEVPYKPKEEFEVKLNYQFKQRPTASTSAVYLDETQREKERRTSSDVLPYLILNVKLLKLSEEEVRIKVINNLSSRVINKKISPDMVLPLDVGFTADMKDRVSPHEYILTFLSPKRSELSKVVIFVEEDGTFLVNGEKRGKF
jgi:hypothetical protein